MKRLFIILAALALAACGSSTELQFNDKNDPGRVTGIKGLDSHDAANILTNRDYVDGKIKAPQKAIVSIKAHPGQQITINAAEFTVWQPSGPQDEIKAPAQAKSAFERNMDATGRLVEKATPLGAAALLVNDRKDARQAGLEATRIEAETIRQGNNLDAAYQQGILELLGDKIPDPPSN